MAVLRPLKVVLTSYGEQPGEQPGEQIDAPYFPPDIGKPGSRPVPIGRALWIERDDFAEEPAKGYLRLAPGRTVRLRYGYCITCDEVVRDPSGEIVELRCTHHPETLGGVTPADGRKVWGVIHWVSAAQAVPAEIRLYDRLFRVARPDDGDGDFLRYMNPASFELVSGAWVEPSLATAEVGSRWQFERQGYFCVDSDAAPGKLVFNRIVTLRDAWTAQRDQAPAEQAAEAEPAAKSAKAKTRPPKRTNAEIRAEARARDPELAARLERFQAAHGLGAEEADLLTGDAATAALFEAALATCDRPAAVARWIINELPRELKDRAVDALPFDGAALGALVALVEAGTVSGPVAKEVFAEMAQRGGDPRAIIAQRGLEQVSDAGAIEPIVASVLAANPDKVAQYRGGKVGLLGFFVGQVVKASQGKANPAMVKALVEKQLG
jgi:glutaminyl-tRNA synthetase